jgi:hypothetical protein
MELVLTYLELYNSNMRKTLSKGPDRHSTKQISGATVIVNFEPYNDVIWSLYLYENYRYGYYLLNETSLDLFGVV